MQLNETRSPARRGLLLGTALGTTLLFAGLLAAGPAHAQSIVDVQDDNVVVDIRTLSFSGKRNTTIENIITNSMFSFPPNNISGLNNADPDQLIDFTQINRLESGLIISNDGFIDPLNGIVSEIENTLILSFANNAAMNNVFGASAAVDVVQNLELAQSNTITSAITKNNSGDIVADQFAIYARITNAQILSLANNVESTNASGTATPITLNDVSQSADFIQTNTIGSDISIINSGDLNAAFGVEALIVTSSVLSLANSVARTLPAEKASRTAASTAMRNCAQSRI